MRKITEHIPAANATKVTAQIAIEHCKFPSIEILLISSRFSFQSSSAPISTTKVEETRESTSLPALNSQPYTPLSEARA